MYTVSQTRSSATAEKQPVIIHRQCSLMVVINRTRKDS